MFKKLPPKLPSSNVTTVTSNVPPTKSVTQTEYSKLACMVNNVTEVTPAIPPADGVTLTEELSCRGEDNDDILTSIQSNSCVVDKERFQEKLRKVSKSEHHLELAANVTTGPIISNPAQLTFPGDYQVSQIGRQETEGTKKLFYTTTTCSGIIGGESEQISSGDRV